jgi:hypothetical protein
MHQTAMTDSEFESSALPCCLRGTPGPGCQRGGKFQGFASRALCLLAVCASLTIGFCQSDPYGANDVGVHRVSLYRKGGPEDKDTARRERNVLVGDTFPSFSLNISRQCFSTTQSAG